MPLTAAEWLRKTCPGATLMSFIEADEYAAYVTSFVPDDVEKAISDYEDTALKMYNEDGMSFLEVVAEAARYGASLAGRMGWINVSDRTPSCFMSGNWDGLKSEPVLAQDKEGKYYVAVVYQGILDGNKFCDWYDVADYEIHNVVKWQYINS